MLLPGKGVAALALCLGSLCLIAPCSAVPPAPPPENIALGCRYALDPQPHYSYCTDPDDKVQLTDGQSVKGYFWTQRGTVGWSHAACAMITVDLKQVQPIAGAAFTTAAGAAGVVWPRAIEIFVSDDGKTFRDQGDLVQLDVREHGPLPKKYAVRRLHSMRLQTRGRYVRFVVLSQGAGYLFTDEVEIFRGSTNWLDVAPQGEVVNDPRSWVRQKAAERAIRHRWQADVTALREKIAQAASVDNQVRSALQAELDGLAAVLDKSPLPSSADFRAVLPIGGEHARLFALQARLWKAQRCDPLCAWTAVAWDPLDPFAAPPREAGAPLEVHAMRGEARAAAVNLADCETQPARVRLRFEGLPGGAAPDYLTLHEVAWTDTSHGQPVAAALPELKAEKTGWTTTVTPGLVRQIWLTFQARDLAPGDYRGTMVLEPERGAARRIPLRLKLWPLELPRQTSLLVGGFCYTNGSGSRAVTAQNRAEFIAHLQSRLVSAPWATGGSLLRFTADRKEPPTIKLDTQEFDQWRRDWPKARMYMVFLAVGDACAGAKRGTPQFARAVAAWISAWAGHWKATGLAPRQVGLLLVDEPHQPAQAERIIEWAQAIRAAEPEVVLWEDPTFADPRKAPAALFDVCDVLCPNRPMWQQSAKLFGGFYSDQKRGGRRLELYSCSGPAQLLDPYSYYRLQAWQNWQIGGGGTYFWALSDASGPSTWNPYQALGGPYTPMFLDPQSVTPGKQMEAIRESAQDYECFAMLRRALETARRQGHRGPVVEQAQRVLDTAVDEVLAAPGAAQIEWHAAKDRTLADAARVKVLESLTALAALPAAQASPAPPWWLVRPWHTEPKLLEWAQKYPQLVTLDRQATYGGRTTYLISVTNGALDNRSKKKLLFSQPHAHEPATTAGMMHFLARLLEGQALDGGPADLPRARLLDQYLLSFLPDGNPDGRARAPEDWWDGTKYPNEEFVKFMFGREADGTRSPRVGRMNLREHRPAVLGIAYEPINPDECLEPNRDSDSSFFRLVRRVSERNQYLAHVDLHQTEYERSPYNCEAIIPFLQAELPPALQAANLSLGQALTAAWQAAGAQPRPEPKPLPYKEEQLQYFRKCWDELYRRRAQVSVEVQNNNRRTPPRTQMALIEAAIRATIDWAEKQPQ